MRRLFVPTVVTLVVATVVACSSSPPPAGVPQGDGGTRSDSSTPSSDTSTNPPSPDGGDDDDDDDAAAQPFALTSSALTNGGTFDLANTCGGANTSPAFSWRAAPAGTSSYAMVLTDKSNDLVHWVLYDIPASATSLPANVDKAYEPSNVAGAKQTTSYKAEVRGYLGPCPPEKHTYEFALYALDVATLPSTQMSTTRDQALAIILDHDLAVAKITATHTPP